jgi:hypothetical protein
VRYYPSIVTTYRRKNLPRHLATLKQNRVYRYSRPRCGMSGFFFIIKTQSTPFDSHNLAA